jgi:predicted AAA+ superfamily ATPase
MLSRVKLNEIDDLLQDFPVVAIVGPRQCGKSTLAQIIASQYPDAVFLDMEDPDDRAILSNPTLFFAANKHKLICLDEIQFAPNLFPILRSAVDKGKRNGQFLLLGSAAPDLLRQSSETLAGRIVYAELAPFSIIETQADWQILLLRGGFPRSYLAKSDKSSLTWRKSFIRTFLERDIAAFGLNLNPQNSSRLWQMCAHYHGKILNYSDFGKALGLTHPTIKHYVDVLAGTFMLRKLQPYYANLEKRLVKTPKLYVADSGILCALLNIQTFDELLGHPIAGFAWEGFVLQNILSTVGDDYEVYFISTSADAEIDILLKKGRKLIGIECKFSTAPKVSKGFYNLKSDLKLSKSFVVAPVHTAYSLDKNTLVCNIEELLAGL